MKQFPCFKQVGLFWNNPPAPRKQGLFPQFDGSTWHWAAMSWEHTFFFICTMVNNGKYLLSLQPRGALCSRDLSQCWLCHTKLDTGGNSWECRTVPAPHWFHLFCIRKATYQLTTVCWDTRNVLIWIQNRFILQIRKKSESVKVIFFFVGRICAI